MQVALDPAAVQFLQTAAARFGWSTRATDRELKVARTIADLSGAEVTQVTHGTEAMQYRRALRGASKRGVGSARWHDRGFPQRRLP